MISAEPHASHWFGKLDLNDNFSCLSSNRDFNAGNTLGRSLRRKTATTERRRKSRGTNEGHQLDESINSLLGKYINSLLDKSIKSISNKYINSPRIGQAYL